MPLSLVILAGGLGSRFGGPKQLTPVGPAGQVIFDYTIADARAVGVDAVVMVVNSTIEQGILDHLSAMSLGSAAPLDSAAAAVPAVPAVRVVCQDRHPLALAGSAAGRRKPLGTAHATLVGMEAAPAGPAIVVNADDLYGPEALRLLATHLRTAPPANGALVTFAVDHTITGPGRVTRALCDTAADGRLRGIEEGAVEGSKWVGSSGRVVSLTGAEPVSMNCWGFPATALAIFDDACRRFVESDRVATDDEVLLPTVVRSMITAGTIFTALATTGRCIGVTHPGDLELVRALLAAP